MNLQTIKSLDGKIEYILLPVAIYYALSQQIADQLKQTQQDEKYEIFDPADYIENPVALARIKAGFTQEELATRMNVTQAYVSKIENQEKVSVKIMQKVSKALSQT